ncbi:MAG TPA: CocE/NonD family hydrolase [Chthonomonadaceae bacterium]|nr:CocE/NonD family hydrolase [Chthonomonadaceae bacterium]
MRPLHVLASFLSFVLLCLLGHCLVSRAQEPTAPPSYDVKAHYTKSSFRIPMRDGVHLYTIVYAPKDTSQPYPILMQRTPYSIRPYEPDTYRLGGRTMQKMVEEGYIFVFQDVRGRYMSEGDFEDVRPEEAAQKGKQAVDESTDTYDTIDWLVKNIPNNNGRVGIWGISYPGFYAAAGGIHSHPALKAISPEAPVSDWFIGDDDHHNGAFFLMDFVSFYNFFVEKRPDNKPVTEYPSTLHFPITDDYQDFLKLGPLKNLNANYWHGQIQHWNDTIAHPNYDAWWQARALPAHLKDIHCAVLTVGGWYDAEDLYGPFADFAAIDRYNPGTPNSLVVGPWPHGGWAGGDFESFGDETFGQKTGAWYHERLFKPFFDFYLKGIGDWKQPKATVFATGINQWWQFDQWPPKDTTPVAYYLSADHALTRTPPEGAAAAGYDEYVSDPAHPVPYVPQSLPRRRNEYMNDDQRFAAARPDVAVWQSAPLTEDFTIAGPIQADLQVSTTGTDADFIVKVIDVQPDGTSSPSGDSSGVTATGYERLVRAEVMRARYRNSYSHPSPLTPNKLTRISFALRDVCHTFLKGHRIMVQVQSSWFPLVDRNPQTYVDIYHADEKDFHVATERIYHTSRILLPQLGPHPLPLPQV